MKFLIIVVLVFFILSTGLMFVLYLASPSTVVELEDQETQELVQETGSIITGDTNTIELTGDIQN